MTAPACAASCGRPSPAAVICRACTRELSRALATAAAISEDLDDAVARLMTRSHGAGRTAATVAPLPLDLAASDAAHALRHCLTRWVRAIHQMPYRMDDPWPAATIAGMARWLTARTDPVRQHEAAGTAHREILAAVRAAVAVIDRPPEMHPAGICAECPSALRAEPGADSTWCVNGHFNEGLRSLRTERAAAADVLGTPGELSAVLAGIGYRVAPSTISSWGTRARIEKRPGGMYRLSDVLALAAQRAHRAS